MNNKMKSLVLILALAVGINVYAAVQTPVKPDTNTTTG